MHDLPSQPKGVIAPSKIINSHLLNCRVNCVTWSYGSKKMRVDDNHVDKLIASGGDDGQIIFTAVSDSLKVDQLNAYTSKVFLSQHFILCRISQ